MRFHQFERDALINFGKKHGYITEDMTEEQIDEIVPALAGAARLAGQGLAKGAKAVGTAAVKGAKAAAPVVKKAAVAGAKKAADLGVKGAKAAGQAVQKGTKAVGQVVDKAKAAGQQIAKSVADTGGDPAQEVPPGADQTPSPTGQAQPGQPAGKPGQKATQKVAQRATALKGVAGGSASGGMVAKGMDKVASGSTLPPNLIKAIAPYTQSIQKMMQDPQLFSKFKLLMKQANAGQ